MTAFKAIFEIKHNCLVTLDTYEQFEHNVWHIIQICSSFILYTNKQVTLVYGLAQLFLVEQLFPDLEQIM
jgi:hypothetical protein